MSVFTRMLDKDSSWGYENGLKSMVTTLLQFGITGYINWFGLVQGAPKKGPVKRWLIF